MFHGGRRLRHHGWSRVPQRSLAERWNGSKQAIQTTLNPASIGFSGASCAAASACTAVGSFFAEGWNGSLWSTQTLPFSTLGEAELFGVSCTAASACTAAGRVENYFTSAIFVNNIFIGQMFTPLGERSS